MDKYIAPSVSVAAVNRFYKKMAEKHGEEKILFATDSPWRDLSTDTKILKSYSLDKTTEEKIFSENARKLLNV